MRNKKIPYGRQFISDQDIQSVVDVLRSDWLTQGPVIEKFEKMVADYCGAKYAVAVNSATSALHLACLTAGLSTGDVFWTSPNTFVASANCGLYCGASVDFVDIDPNTYNLNAAELEKKLVLARRNNTLPKIVIPVHFSGQSCEMDRIKALSKEYGFKLIEDASHAIGGRYKGNAIGGCQFSDMTVFSFHPVKIITTGEGGMILTNQQDIYERLVRLRSHGITREPDFMTREPDGSWYYQQIELGFNYRITDIQAALGCSQMQRVDEFINSRHQLASRYNELLQGLPLILPYQQPDSYSAYHLYVIRLNTANTPKSHREVFDELQARGIMVNVHYIPVHTQPYYINIGFHLGDFPESERYYNEAISLPIYFSLSIAEQDVVIKALRDIFL